MVNVNRIICPVCSKQTNCFAPEFFGTLKAGMVSACKCGTKLCVDSVVHDEATFRIATKADIKALDTEGKKRLELFVKANKKK